VDADTARLVIREQDEVVRSELRSLLDGLDHRVNDVRRRVLAHRKWPRSPKRALSEVRDWASAEDRRFLDLTRGLMISSPCLLSVIAVDEDLGKTWDDVDEVTSRLVGYVADLDLRRKVQAPLIPIPPDKLPSRQGRLKEGVLARLVAEDLAAQIDRGRALEANLQRQADPLARLRGWTGGASKILEDGLAPWMELNVDFIFGVHACECPLVTDPIALGRAYVALAVAYLREVHARMPEYAEASGQAMQEPRVSLTFSGGSFYGGQFAAHIANANSTVTGLAQNESPEVADALTALKQAVLSQKGLDEEIRRDLLDSIGHLAEAAQTPAETRDHRVVKSILTALKVAAASGGELGQALDAWSSVFHRLLL
jgi:hypothetical protein